ncbi:hypothetical protein, partial [Methylobrevis pamukkalensis]|uniref:hypothetical protein n=1 Tax=Methylobrevis pamukkalensis TaxID=1439726 RepID=UPI001AED08D8
LSVSPAIPPVTAGAAPAQPSAFAQAGVAQADVAAESSRKARMPCCRLPCRLPRKPNPDRPRRGP